MVSGEPCRSNSLALGGSMQLSPGQIKLVSSFPFSYIYIERERYSCANRNNIRVELDIYIYKTCLDVYWGERASIIAGHRESCPDKRDGHVLCYDDEE